MLVPDVLEAMVLQFPHHGNTFRDNVSRRRMLLEDNSKAHTLLTPKEVASVLRVSDRTVINMAAMWIDSGGKEGIPSFRLGKLWRFKAEAFRRWLEKQGLFEESQEVTELLRKAQ